MGSIRKRTLKSEISSVLLYQKTLPNQSGKGYPTQLAGSVSTGYERSQQKPIDPR